MTGRLFAAFTFLIALVSAPATFAQNVFLQIEAHPSLNTAQDRARRYAGVLSDVNGFRLGSGWYVVALGPYDTDTAISRINQLKSQRAIPPDSYIVDPAVYRQQFYPIGGSALNAVAVQPQSQPQSQQTETAAAPAQPIEPPEETRREALRIERNLTRQEKFNLQIALKWFGFYEGRIDAAFGPGTRNSMAAWQTSNGYEPTGVLTTRQRAALTGAYEKMLATLSIQTVKDIEAGIDIDLPTAMVKFSEYSSPFAHYESTDGSGVKVLLISQSGDESTLLGLYDIMQTLRIVPLEGERERRSNRFTLTGEDDKIISYTQAVLDDGELKGFTLIWPQGEDRRRNLVLNAMRDSFAPVKGVVLPDTLGAGALEQSIDLVSGLEIRRPDYSRSGFYVDGGGLVLTTASAVQSCNRVTLDEIYEAELVATDDALGLALLKPQEALAPIDYARFMPGIPRLKSEVAVAGYSFEGALGAPTMTFGTLADMKGLRGEQEVNRLALAATIGDAGGPVFDTTGSVMGMLLPGQSDASRQLPSDVSFAADAVSLIEFMSDNGVSPSASDRTDAMAAEHLTAMATNLTVLVSCWN